MRKEMTAVGATPIILALLAEREDYGYSLIRRLKSSSGELFEWAEGMLYPILHRLEQQGYLESRFDSTAGKRGERGRRRKYYAVTDRGRAYLTEIMDEWKRIFAVIEHIGSGKEEEREDAGN